MISYNKISVRVNLDNLRHNYRVFRKRGTPVIPIIKSDAYGCGLDACRKALESEGVDTLGVGFVSEAMQLRGLGFQGRILALLGPVDDDDLAGLWSHEVLAAIAHRDQLERVARMAKAQGPLDICLKFNTGMGRLGFDLDDLVWLVDFLKEHRDVRPVMVTSHLANADDPDLLETVEAQARRFSTVLGRLTGEGFEVEANLANSAGTLGHEPVRHDSVRLGIGMYGGNPFFGTQWAHLGKDIRPVMDVSAPVLQVRELQKGQPISYGWTYTADSDQTVAIIGVGYADGYSRLMSNKGAMNIAGHRAPIRGRICMQMTAVDITSLVEQGVVVRPGDRAFLLGGPQPGFISPEDLAGWWGTITYEAFCLLGMNPRTYIGE